MEQQIKELTLSVPDGLPSISLSKVMKEDENIADGYKITYNIEKIDTDKLFKSIDNVYLMITMPKNMLWIIKKLLIQIL